MAVRAGDDGPNAAIGDVLTMPPMGAAHARQGELSKGELLLSESTLQVEVIVAAWDTNP